jgi:hypothetical protein
LAVGLVLVCLVLAPVAAAKPASKPPIYNVKMTFTQHRLWTYYYQQTAPDCTRTDDGHGSEDAIAKAKATFTMAARGRSGTGFGATGTDSLVGSRTHTVAGATCAPSAVFPSTWSKIAEADGTVTYAEPTSGCGPQPTKVSFSTLELKGKTLNYEWDSAPLPDFGECPDFQGSNQAQPGHELPGSQWLDVSAKVDRRALLAGKHKVTATGAVEISETETCANIVQGCAEGVTYNATGSLKTEAKFVFTPRR